MKGPIRLAFITGCVEPGRDGVGDYTRAVAAECARRAHPALIIALADRYAQGTCSEDASEGVRVLRLPQREPWSTRLAAGRAALRAFQPTWVSLQYVPYSYDRRGIPLRFAAALGGLVSPARLHVMLHETWIGPRGSWRRPLISTAQRWAALSVCRRAGRAVHTSNPVYRAMLAEHGVRATVLPLFGSIPVLPPPVRMPKWLVEALASAGATDMETARSSWWVVVLFGTIHPEWTAEPFLGRLRAAGHAVGKRVAVVAVGRLGRGESTWTAVEQRNGREIVLLRLGEQPEPRISELLHVADFGVATSPYSLIGKSSTVAAMLDHGLPVIVTREDGPASVGEDDDSRRTSLVIRASVDMPRRLIEARKLPPEWRMSAVVEQMLDDLDAVAQAASR